MKTKQIRGGLLIRGLLAAVVCLVLGLLVLAGCPLAVMDDYPIETRSLDTKDSLVRNYNLQAYVPVPTEGAVPVKAVSGRLDLEASVVWMDETGDDITGTLETFVLDAVYQARITLTAKPGYAFDEGTAFQYYPVDAVETQSVDNAADVRELSVTYKRTTAPLPIPAEDLDLTAHIPAPVMRATAVTGFYAGTYGGTVTWKTGGAAAAGLFQADTVYTAELTLYPAPGYTLAGSSFTYAGSGELNDSAGWTNTGSALTGMTVTFPATTSVAAVVVNDLDLTYKVPSPVRGGTPTAYFSAPQYTGRVDWLVRGSEAPHSVFQANMAYTAKVTLTAASGYTLGNPAVSFTHGNAATITADNGNGTLTVTAAFPATTETTAVPVNDRDLTYKIPQPVNGGTPAVYFSTPQYTGNVVWSVTAGGQSLSGLFGANTAYTAAVTLTAASGYTFEGVNLNGFFQHSGGANVISALNGNPVKIRFSATNNTAAIPVSASDLDLTYHVPAPVRGGTPVRYVSDPQYTGNVAWSVTAGGHALNGLFEAGTAYTATVTLTAASGYTFTGVGANAFTHNGNNALNSAGSGVVTIAFPATAPNQTTMINSVDLTNVLPGPITGASPHMSFNTGTYSGTAVWRTSGGALATIFEVGTVYTATVTLYPALGYSFPAALPVTHGGITIADFTGEPRQGAITFPATGILVLYNGPFSGSSTPGTGDNDSAIDVIRMAKAADHPLMYLQLSPRSKEEVTPSSSVDIGSTTEGLVLQHSGDPTTDNSPPIVAIDGGKRIIELQTAGSLITVGEGVTLTLRNITLIGFNTFPIVNVESDGRVIYETGVSIIEKTALPFSGFTTKTDSAIDKIRARGSDPMTLILSPGTEGVNLNNTSDLGAGLILDNTNSPAVVTIDGQGREVRLDAGSANGSVITVRAGVTLTLTNITLGGKNNNAPLIRVDGGTLVLEDGAHITGNTRNGGDPLANVNNSSVYDESAYGGGGGIVVHNGGSLEMRDNSEISGNYTSAVGGGVLVYGANSKVTMKGSSKISGNEASGAAGGGVYLSDGGALYMSGNAGITGNKTILAIDTGEQYGSGGGVLAINNSSIEMDGASKISYNHSKHRGAGVAIGSGSSLKMTGYSEISDNECDNWGGWGGGIYLFGNNDVTTATMNQNAGIKRNKASGGAGVSAMNDGATSTTFTMNGGFISNNIATSDSAGGVDVCEMVFNMTGGVISGNTTPGNGGGVSVGGGSARFNMTGGVIYGSGASGNDSDGNPLKNTAAGSGAAVFVESGGVSNVNTTDKTVMNGQVQP